MRYYKQQGEKECPSKLCRRDILTKMNEWIAQGDLLILPLEANEYMNNGNLVRAIRLNPRLNMKDLVR